MAKSKDELAFSWPEASRGLGWTVICAALAFTVIVGTAVLSPRADGAPTTAVQFACELAAFLVIAGPMTYYGLAIIVSRHRIVVTHTEAIYSFGPLPLYAQRRIATQDVIQWYVKDKLISTSHGQSSYGLSIRAIDKSMGAMAFTGLLPSSEAAYWICHELQDFCGLKDMEIYGVTTHPHHPGPRGS